MASKDRTPAADLSGHFETEGNRYAFFQAVELIQNRLDQKQDVGTHRLASDEKLFFEVAHNLAFPLSDVVSIKPLSEEGPDSERFSMMVSFLGLHGSGTPLPSYYAEQIARSDAQGSVTKGFLDFFHNRVIGLLYRSWKKYRYHRRYQPGGEDQFSSWMFSLFGLGSPDSRASTNIYWPRLLCFAGMLSTRNRSPNMMATIIAHAFKLDSVSVEEWVKRKVDIAPEQRSRLGRKNAQLGQSFVIGSHAPDIQGKIRIVIRNLDFNRFQDFLPHGKDFKPLRGLIEFMFRDQLAYDLKLSLLPREASPLSLKTNCPGRLGWSSFLGDKKYGEMRDVVIKVRS